MRWINNYYGQLGDDTLIDKNILTQINCNPLELLYFNIRLLSIYPNPTLDYIYIK